MGALQGNIEPDLAVLPLYYWPLMTKPLPIFAGTGGESVQSSAESVLVGCKVVNQQVPSVRWSTRNTSYTAATNMNYSEEGTLMQIPLSGTSLEQK